MKANNIELNFYTQNTFNKRDDFKHQNWSEVIKHRIFHELENHLPKKEFNSFSMSLEGYRSDVENDKEQLFILNVNQLDSIYCIEKREKLQGVSYQCHIKSIGEDQYKKLLEKK